MLRKPRVSTDDLEARVKALSERATPWLFRHLLVSEDPTPRPATRQEIFLAASLLESEHSHARISDRRAAAEVDRLGPLVDESIAAYRAHWAVHGPPPYGLV